MEAQFVPVIAITFTLIATIVNWSKLGTYSACFVSFVGNWNVFTIRFLGVTLYRHITYRLQDF